MWVNVFVWLTIFRFQPNISIVQNYYSLKLIHLVCVLFLSLPPNFRCITSVWTLMWLPAAFSLPCAAWRTCLASWWTWRNMPPPRSSWAKAFSLQILRLPENSRSRELPSSRFVLFPCLVTSQQKKQCYFLQTHIKELE